VTTHDRNRRLLDFCTRHAPGAPDSIQQGSAVDRITIEWKHRGWAMGIVLRFNLETMKAAIDHSTTHRNVVNALAFASLYRAVVEFAAMLEVYAESLPEPEEEYRGSDD
jgi:hypothetical protein